MVGGVTMKNKKVSLGDVIYYPISEIGGETIIKGKVVEVANDHVIMRADDVNYWLEDEDYYINKKDAQDFLDSMHPTRMAQLEIIRAGLRRE